MKSFLSIDMDFWNSDFFPRGGERSSKAFIRKVMQLNIPVHYCFDHAGMVGLVDESKARHLINVDFHSDLDNERRGRKYLNPLDCGNWVNHVAWKQDPRAHYTWVHPSEWFVDGLCHATKEGNPFTQWQDRSYVHASMELGVRNLFENYWIEGVAIAISPDFIIGDNVNWLLKKLCPEAHKHWKSQQKIDECRDNFRTPSKILAAHVYTHISADGREALRQMRPLTKEMLA